MLTEVDPWMYSLFRNGSGSSNCPVPWSNRRPPLKPSWKCLRLKRNPNTFTSARFVALRESYLFPGLRGGHIKSQILLTFLIKFFLIFHFSVDWPVKYLFESSSFQRINWLTLWTIYWAFHKLHYMVQSEVKSGCCMKKFYGKNNGIRCLCHSTQLGIWIGYMWIVPSGSRWGQKCLFIG